MNLKLISCLLIGVLAFSGCSYILPGERLKIGGKHKVSLYSGGELVRTWISAGTVDSDSGRFWFLEDGTGEKVVISGDIVVEVLQ